MVVVAAVTSSRGVCVPGPRGKRQTQKGAWSARLCNLASLCGRRRDGELRTHRGSSGQHEGRTKGMVTLQRGERGGRKKMSRRGTGPSSVRGLSIFTGDEEWHCQVVF